MAKFRNLLKLFEHQDLMPWEQTPKVNVPPSPKKPNPVLQGPSLLPMAELRNRAEAILNEYGEEYAWPLGPFRLPHKLLYGHVLCMGVTGAGKSTIINQIMRATLRTVGEKAGHRACIWDFRGETLQYLAGIGLWGPVDDPLTGEQREGSIKESCPVHYINPTDKRGVGVDMARDLRTEHDADQFAAAMLGSDAKKESDSEVWLAAARNALSLVIQFFQEHAGYNWKFIDVIEACFYKTNLKNVLRTTREGREILRESLGTEGQSKGVMFTIQSFARALRPIAAAMAHRPLVSLADWVEGQESVIVIGNRPKFQKQLAPFQKWVFEYLSRSVLEQEISEKNRYLFFLDEVRWAPFGSALNELATNGRAKGACLIAGLQDKDGLRTSLGEHLDDEFIGMFSTHVFLALRSTETMEWASRFFGKHIAVITEKGRSTGTQTGESFGKSQGGSWGPQGGSSSDSTSWQWNSSVSTGENESYREMERALVLPSEFRTLGLTREIKPHGLVVDGFFSLRGIGDGRVQVGEMETKTIKRVDTIKTKDPVENDDLKYEWGHADILRLGGSPQITGAFNPSGRSQKSPPQTIERTVNLDNLKGSDERSDAIELDAPEKRDESDSNDEDKEIAPEIFTKGKKIN